MQFDWLDSGIISNESTDILLIQKLTSELSLDKNQMLAEMAKQSEIERNKSILGKLGKESNHEAKPKAKEEAEDTHTDHARQNLIRRIKEMKIFSLEETNYKLKRADWLKYVCW